jgi:hypothetical protein
MRKSQTKSEKIAIKLMEISNDVTLDLDQIGIYLARLSPNVSFRRLNEIIESANYEKESQNVREYPN